MAQSSIRQNFHEECEALINKQINMEMYASYVYLAMAYYFDRDDVALAGFAKMFRKCSDEERDHSKMFMEYQNSRGGRIVLQDVAKPNKNEFGTAAEAVKAALELEKGVNESLLKLHETSGKHGDPHLCDYLESHFLDEQVKSIKELGDLYSRLKRAGDGVGVHLIDTELKEH